MEHKLCALISSIQLKGPETEEVLKACVLVMDDIALTIKRYEMIRDKHEQPIEFFPGESYVYTLIVPSIVYEKI